MAKSKSTVILRPDEAKCWARTGEVVGSAIYTSTHVSGGSSGGGGYVHNGVGHVSAPQVHISSTVTTHNRFFLKEDDGDETEIKLANSSFGVRDGQRITGVWASHVNDGSGWLVYLHNHNSGRGEEQHAALEDLRGRTKKRWAFLAAIGTIVGLFSGLLPLALIAPGTWLYFFLQKRKELAAIDHAIFEMARAKVAEAQAPSPRLVHPEPGDVAAA
jgi:hypothetical protein